MGGLHRDCWRQVIFAQISTALGGGYPVYSIPTDTFIVKEKNLVDDVDTIVETI